MLKLQRHFLGKRQLNDAVKKPNDQMPPKLSSDIKSRVSGSLYTCQTLRLISFYVLLFSLAASGAAAGRP